MTQSQSKKESSFRERFLALMRAGSYLKINIILAGVIILVIAYSGIFSPEKNNYPVACIHEKITGMKCFSCGISHSFSLIVRGRISEAYTWNVYGLRVFLFFFSQLLLRITFSVFYVNRPAVRRQITIYDAAGTIALFVIAFYPFFRQIILEFVYTFK